MTLNTMKTLPLALLLILLLAACGSDEADDLSAEPNTPAHAHATAEDAANTAETTPTIVDGVQVIEIEAGLMGFEPKKIALEAGVPARLVFTRTAEAACSEQVQIPALGIEKTDLPLNEPVAIAFTTEKGGSFTFVCGMDMQTGTLLVEV
jgi:plastocyanin domain-containing protein